MCFTWWRIEYDFITTWEDPVIFDECRVFTSNNGDPTIVLLWPCHTPVTPSTFNTRLPKLSDTAENCIALSTSRLSSIVELSFIVSSYQNSFLLIPIPVYSSKSISLNQDSVLEGHHLSPTPYPQACRLDRPRTKSLENVYAFLFYLCYMVSKYKGENIAYHC